MQDPEALIKELEEKLRKAEARVADAEERYQHLIEGVHGLICTHDLDGVLLSINPAACEALGYTSEELLGRNIRDLMSPLLKEHFHLFLERINSQASDKGILHLHARDGRELTFQYHNIKITRNVDEPYVLGHAYDITELTDLQRQLAELAVTDDLTGLSNRRGFLSQAEARMEIARRSGELLALIFADVDGLKKVNDQYGHEMGSRMIIDTAHLLKQSFRQADVLARWGGDEFVVLLGHGTSDTQDIVLERLQTKISEFNESSSDPYELSVSFGVAAIDLKSETPIEEVIAQADTSMYEQKRKKKS